MDVCEFKWNRWLNWERIEKNVAPTKLHFRALARVPLRTDFL